ncbi:hypothetical protein NSK_006958 [Nannochloropsis salina CCMP1776]|uniref:Adenylosuccinate lyase n=1 Tax=Nannochloropsis salina CCMP1776 TaxID=1027361 RepID=A0A4D9CYW1_9STRA|nr:hypothetical protein NSK_006958 [Nannochloropsis salina CCMP1776]|eukprot:TFJ81709.1 hypothetical protein NSK_006958 [Nannochloropsis salina CCMP1776]
MSYIWSPEKKFSTWRRLWIALAKAEQELGIPITDEQIAQMEEHIMDIDFERAEEKEAETRHDVMAHVYTFGECCPAAQGIIHMGATSCFVGDNTDIVQLKEGMELLQRKIVKLLDQMKTFALEHRAHATLGFTHYQAAQLTTVGKRMTLYMQDFLMDLEHLDREMDDLPLRGLKGTTGTQATFLELFGGDHAKVKECNRKVCEYMGFKKWIAVSGQTYTRKIDYHILSILSGVAQSAYKMCGDIRLLANLKEIEEPFGKDQIGSSAMAYKRNPMRSERVCSLARYVMSLPAAAAQTHATQWFERTLDDSSIRRIILPEAFLAVDVILNIVANITDGLQVWPQVIRAHVMAELPFMATEKILMACCKKGGDRQVLHHAIRAHSMEAGKVVKAEGKANDLLERVRRDPLFAAIHEELDDLVDPMLFVGRAPEQVDEFMVSEIVPMLNKHHILLMIDNQDGEDDEVEDAEEELDEEEDDVDDVDEDEEDVDDKLLSRIFIRLSLAAGLLFIPAHLGLSSSSLLVPRPLLFQP